MLQGHMLRSRSYPKAAHRWHPSCALLASCKLPQPAKGKGPGVYTQRDPAPHRNPPNPALARQGIVTRGCGESRLLGVCSTPGLEPSRTRALSPGTAECSITTHPAPSKPQQAPWWPFEPTSLCCQAVPGQRSPGHLNKPTGLSAMEPAPVEARHCPNIRHQQELAQLVRVWVPATPLQSPQILRHTISVQRTLD